MSITLDILILPDLFFENRFDWTGVEAETERAKAGNVIAFERSISGRAIDLNGDPEGAWMTYAEIQALRSLAAVPGAVYDLDLHGEAKKVRFRHEESPVITADPVLDKRTTDPADTQYFNNVKIKMMEV